MLYKYCVILIEVTRKIIIQVSLVTTTSLGQGNSKDFHLPLSLQPAYKTSTVHFFLAHLSRRLTGELIGYPWIRRLSSSSVHIFKHLLL